VPQIRGRLHRLCMQRSSLCGRKPGLAANNQSP
jgi:hypothetical protein